MGVLGKIGGIMRDWTYGKSDKCVEQWTGSLENEENEAAVGSDRETR